MPRNRFSWTEFRCRKWPNQVIAFGLAMFIFLGEMPVWSQSSNGHFFSDGNSVPGEVAFQKLLANPHWQTRIQPVKLIVPQGCEISVWNQSQFQPAGYDHPLIGISVGPVYRFRVSNIPELGNVEIFPSLELIGQLTPPPGLETRFPIPVCLHHDDLRAASEGRMVVKVIYLENPETALPYRQLANDQPFFDVNDREDPLRTAERLGRPIALVRLGSRIPSREELGSALSASGIPLTLFPESISTSIASVEANLTSAPVREQVPVTSSVVPSPCGSCGTAGEWQGFSCPAPLWQSGTATIPAPTIQPDEFLCDGADRNFKVRVDDDGNVGGLDSEDTIGHFRTFDGKRGTTESNRVCIYAPRFAAVRKVSRAGVSERISRVAGYKDYVEMAGLKSQEVSTTTMQQLQPAGHRLATRASSLAEPTRGVLSEQVLIPNGLSSEYQAYENLSLIRFGKHRSSESARLNLGMESASSWVDNLGLQVAEKNIQPIIARDPQRVHEVSVVDSKHTSQLRLVKIADKLAAEPGEVVEFTIRFDNIGSRPIDQVTIIDNLTTRLEYVAESTECSLAATFRHSENEGQSLVLTWALSSPLPVGKGGIIRFKCRVR